MGAAGCVKRPAKLSASSCGGDLPALYWRLGIGGGISGMMGSIGFWRALAFAAAATSLSACASIDIADQLPQTGGAPVWNGPTPTVERLANPLQCVPFARQASGIEIYGDAYTWWTQAEGRYPRSSIPAAGSVLVLRGYNDAARGHVAVVTEVVSEREILVDQANWMNQGEITRRVPVMDVSLANDWSEVRVWWIPTNAWGGRVYQGQGFIHPMPVLMAGS